MVPGYGGLRLPPGIPRYAVPVPRVVQQSEPCNSPSHATVRAMQQSESCNSPGHATVRVMQQSESCNSPGHATVRVMQQSESCNSPSHATVRVMQQSESCNSPSHATVRVMQQSESWATPLVAWHPSVRRTRAKGTAPSRRAGPRVRRLSLRLGPHSGACSVSQPCAAAPQMGRRASLSIHGPDRTAELIQYAIGDSPPTLRVGPNTGTAGPEDQCPPPVTGAVAVRYLGADNWRRST